MTIISKLASALNRRDEIPNQELALEIAKTEDTVAIKELIDNLQHKDKNIQSDCIKVLYEIGEHAPSLIAAYDTVFLSLLEHKNNRLAWGAMTALDCIASVKPEGIYKNLPEILTATDKGSVITKDHGINILIKLAGKEQYHADAMNLLLEQFRKAATNQLPMYAENVLPVITTKDKAAFITVLTQRLPEIEKESKQKRVEKVIKKLSK